MPVSQAVLELLVELKDQASNGLSSLGSALGVAGVAGGALVAGLTAAGAAAFDFASDAQQGVNDFQAALGVSADEAERLGDIATDVFKNNWGDSLGDVNESLLAVRGQMRGLSDQELADATEAAIALRDTFGVDVAESTNAANTLMQQFGLTSQQAFDFIAKAQQEGLNSSGDLLDTIGEYSTQFAAGGATASEFFSLLESGLQGGVLGTDKAADAFKEFRVRIQDGSTATSAGLAQLGIDATALSEQMASGQVTAADAFQLVLDKLNETDDANVRMQAGVALLGTQFEDLGTEGALALSMTGTALEDMAGATDSLNAKYNTLGSLIEGSKRQFLVALQPLGDMLLEVANDIIPHVIPVVELLVGLITDGLTSAGDSAGFFSEIMDAAGPILEDIQAAAAEVFNTLWTEGKPILDDLGTIALPALTAAGRVLASLWDTVLAPTLMATWDIFKNYVLPAIGDVVHVLSIVLPPAIDVVASLFTDVLLPAMGNISQGLDYIGDSVNDVIGFFNNLGSSLTSIEIPDWLQGHSPPPLANWFQDIAGAAENAQGSAGGLGFGANTGALPALAPSAGGLGGGVVWTGDLIVQGHVMTEQQLVEVVRQGLIDIGRRNVNIFGEET